MRKLLLALIFILPACLSPDAPTSAFPSTQGWKDLGTPTYSVHVYRYCDGATAVYAIVPSGNSAGISTVSGSGEC